MSSALIPWDETARLAVLHELEVLDTAPELKFDELTRLVAETLDVPIALISLIDEDRQWFKSHHGIDATETPREHAFCAHAILDDEVLVVEDASKDPRFSDNPLVTADPNIRFYAGAPLKTASGHKLGTLCAIDGKPRQIGYDKMLFLEVLAQHVVDLLRTRKIKINQGLAETSSSDPERDAAVSAEIQALFAQAGKSST